MSSAAKQRLLACLIAAWLIHWMTQNAAAGEVDFKKQIQPIFQDRCYECHGPKKRESGLRLDKRQEALAGGDSGPAIVPGDTKNGLLLQMIRSPDAEQVMPPKGDRLTRQQIQRIEKWIEDGAPWPEED